MALRRRRSIPSSAPMRSVTFLSSSNMLGTGKDRRPDAFEHELEFPPLARACEGRGLRLEAQAWDAPGLDSAETEAFVIGTTWDYMERPGEFLARLDALAGHRPLLNPLSTVRWNLEKGYLQELEQAGIPTVPTHLLDTLEPSDAERAYETWSTDRLVAKPRVGAGAWRQATLRRGAPLPPAEELPPGQLLLQPFLPSIQTEGEFSFVFFGEVFSHAIRKLPGPGDYRVQSMYGATESVHEPTAAEIERVRTIVQAAPGPLLYARVDMVQGLDGELALMELELIEPYLYPEQGPGLGEPFVDRLVELLAGR